MAVLLLLREVWSHEGFKPRRGSHLAMTHSHFGKLDNLVVAWGGPGGFQIENDEFHAARLGDECVRHGVTVAETRDGIRRASASPSCVK
jgi:hypothetical protein